MVSRHNVHTDAGTVCLGDGVRNFRSRRIEHGHDPEEAQPSFDVGANIEIAIRLEAPAGHRQESKPRFRILIHNRGDHGSIRFGQRPCLVMAPDDLSADGQHSLGCALGVCRQRVVAFPVDGGHALYVGVEVEDRETGGIPLVSAHTDLQVLCDFEQCELRGVSYAGAIVLPRLGGRAGRRRPDHLGDRRRSL